MSLRPESAQRSGALGKDGLIQAGMKPAAWTRAGCTAA